MIREIRITNRNVPTIGVGGGTATKGEGFSAFWVTDSKGNLKRAIFHRDARPCHADQAIVAVRRGDVVCEAYGTGPFAADNPNCTLATWRVADVNMDEQFVKLIEMPSRFDLVPPCVIVGANIRGNCDGRWFVAEVKPA